MIWSIQYNLRNNQEISVNINTVQFVSPLHSPRHLFPGLGQRVRALFEQILSKAQHVSLNILRPLDVAHVKVEGLAVVCVQGSQQCAHILIPKLPLVHCKVLQTLDGLQQFVLDPLHAKRKRAFEKKLSKEISHFTHMGLFPAALDIRSNMYAGMECMKKPSSELRVRFVRRVPAG